MNLNQRSYKKELLDEDAIPFDALEKNLHELNFINTYLGGHAITINGIKHLIGNKKTVTVCEIGCGGGDNLVAIYKWCTQHKIELKVIGIDIKQDCINIAKQQTFPEAAWIIDDYKNAVFDVKPDIIFSSLFCHHFTDEQLMEQLQWMKANSQLGFFINDLQRHWLAYFSIKFLTKIFSHSYLVKHDAPLSVARGFVKKEWCNLLDASTIPNYTIQWQWAFRYLIIYKHD